MTQSKRIATTPGEALAVVALCFGWPIVLSARVVLAGFQIEQGGFSNVGALFTVAYEIVLSLAAFALLRRRGYDVASLVPHPTWIDSAIGLALFGAAWIAGALAVAPFAVNWSEQPIAHMMRASTIMPPVALLMSVVNGAFEEVFLLGFLMRGLRGLGLSTSLGVMMLVRMSYHLYQGPLGATWMLGVGLVFGLYHARAQRLWPVVFAHMVWDFLAFM
jgi:membrane protease YdiL (CAAX protease family)